MNQSSLLRRLLLLVATIGCALRGAANDPFDALPQRLEPFVERGQIAGAVLLLADRDEILHHSAVGMSDLATGRKMEPDDLFWIASMSKPITAVAVALLVEAGQMDFDDAVQTRLPAFADLSVAVEGSAGERCLVPASRRLTVRDLLTHTSGLGEYTVNDPHWNLAERALVVSREPLRFQPGTQWGYSTAGFDVLGRIVEVVSGLPFDRFLQTRLFDPVGMTETTFWLTPAQLDRFARNYRPEPSSGSLVEAGIPYLYGTDPTDRKRPPLGGAGLFSTAGDIARFYQMMLRGGVANGERILQAETVATLTRPHTGALATRPGMPWGLGFCVVTDPDAFVSNHHFNPGTFGHGGAHGTQSWADPVSGITYVFMIQRAALRPNPDDSAMRRAYQAGAAAALRRVGVELADPVPAEDP